MKIRVLAWITFLNLLRNRLILLIVAVLICVVLLMMTPLIGAKAMSADSAQTPGMIPMLVSGIMSLVSGFGSLLAAWSAADAVASEMKSGTILAVMARPVRRWEFLLGKYLGVMMLMGIYVAFMYAVSSILAWIGGERVVTNPWVLLVYPMVRYGIYAAAATWLVAVMHPVFAFALVLIAAVLASLAGPNSNGLGFLPGGLRRGLFLVLPSTNLLDETNFLALTSEHLKAVPWTQHVTALAYGLDCSVVFFLFAAWAFRRRGLSRE